jgi:hypothetical protein
MTAGMEITGIVATPFLKRVDGRLRQLARVSVRHEGPIAAGMFLVTADGSEVVSIELDSER